MAELLVAKGYHRIVGASRALSTRKVLIPSIPTNCLELVAWDMLNQRRITEVVAEYQPSEIYNFAAYSSGAGMFDDSVAIGEVNGLAVARILEAIRAVDTSIRFCQASSSELFGDALENPQSETTPLQPRSPYGAAKLYAHSMIKIYRGRYQLFACSAILFNHESPRRGLGFVSRKITHQAAKIKLGLASELRLGNLESRRDWGFAGDYVQAMWLMLQQALADDYVVATGKTHSVRDLCQAAFEHLGLNYADFVRVDSASFRPIEPVELVGDIKKAKDKLGWSPATQFREMVGLMVDADMQMLRNTMRT